MTDMSVWQGRIDAAEGPLGQRWHQVMRPLDSATPAGTTVLIGFACDAGVVRNQARPGAAQGPAAIRHALRNMPVHECRMLADGGDIVCEGDALEAAQQSLAGAVARELAEQRFPIVLGGGHEMALGSFSGLAAHLAKDAGVPRIGIVNFDAHFDLRQDARGTSGTPFLQIARECETRGWPFLYACLGVSRYSNTAALFARADRLSVLWRLDEAMATDSTAEALASFIGSVDALYLTFCLDVLPAAVAPGVSAPAARGVGLDVLEPLIDAVVASGRLRLADIAEMNPQHDVDGRTATVAAAQSSRASPTGWHAGGTRGGPCSAIACGPTSTWRRWPRARVSARGTASVMTPRWRCATGALRGWDRAPRCRGICRHSRCTTAAARGSRRG